MISLFAKPENMTLKQWQIALRKQIAEKEAFFVTPIRNSYGEFIVSNAKNKNEYKVVYRGEDSEWNYCSCMDFKTSKLGTCKHIEAVKLTNPKAVLELPSYSSIYLSYMGAERCVKIRIGYENQNEISEISKKYFTSQNTLMAKYYEDFSSVVDEISGYGVHIYNDVLEFISKRRDAIKRDGILEKKYTDSELDKVLKANLYPYQKEGVRFAFRNGKAIIADEMGLGKTIQAICAAEIYKREGLIENTLIVCPTSLKYQWKRELEKFTGDQDILVIEGNHLKRMEMYNSSNHYKIISYNSLCNDIKITGGLSFDLVVMDEVQRLKNWNTQIAKAIRKLDCNYSVILSGTPLENKLEDLYSIVQIADQFCLGPYYKFRSEHVLTDENGKTIGYKNLNSIKDNLVNVLIRRKKSEVHLQLPNRIDKNLLIPITEVQMEMHEEFKAGVSRIVNKWKQMKFLSETDRLRLMMLMGNMRMVCDSTYILDQKTRDDTKVDEVYNIVRETIDSTDEKVVIFSQWERMTRIIAEEFKKGNIKYEYLHGGVPSAKRKAIIDNFNDDPKTRVFLSTDAGGVGLNLQSASVIINVDLPWNPAVLEQRIARIWRIGQQRNIQVINLIAKGTIEEGMIGKLRFKSAMALGALDGGEDTIYLDDDKFSTIVETIGSYITEEVSIDEDSLYKEGEEKANNPDIVVSEEDDILLSSEPNLFTTSNPDDESNSSGISSSEGHNVSSGHIQANALPKEKVQKSIDFMSKMQKLLSSKSICNMLVGAMAMEDPEHIQEHIKEIEENRNNIEELLGIMKQFSESSDN